MEHPENKTDISYSPFEIRDDVHSGIWYTKRSKKKDSVKKLQILINIRKRA